jgi:glutathione S-transferase
MVADPALLDDTLYIGTRRYSSWSMRGWLAVRLAGLNVRDEVIPIQGGGGTTAIQRISPNGLVPYLRHAGNEVWETLAICEYCAEHAPALWPKAASDRALARSVAAEMHSGFRNLRIAMPMNLGADRAGIGDTPDVRADIARIEAIWQTCLTRGGGPFLFGAQMSAADAMYAPVVARFLSYHPPLSDLSHAYCQSIRSHELVCQWYNDAAAEPLSWRLDRYENIQ